MVAVFGMYLLLVVAAIGTFVGPNVASAQTCSSPNGLMGGGLLSDSAAAAQVKLTQQSKVENGAFGTASQNAAADDYYYNYGTSAYYASQLAGFHSAWSGDAIMQRVDGACNLGPHPTMAMIQQWAAHKWNLSPLIAYAEPTNDGKWDITSAGDLDSTGHNGCSIGQCQIAYCNNDLHPNHCIAGLLPGTPGHLLPKENTCFNADLWAAFVWKHYSGSQYCGYHNIVKAMTEWGSSTCVNANYQSAMCNSIATHDWQGRFFSGQYVPY